MKKQRICIIGDGLSGLVTCLAMKDTGLSIDLYSSPGDDNFDKRITAISESNFVSLNL